MQRNHTDKHRMSHFPTKQTCGVDKRNVQQTNRQQLSVKTNKTFLLTILQKHTSHAFNPGQISNNTWWDPRYISATISRVQATALNAEDVILKQGVEDVVAMVTLLYLSEIL